MRLLEGNKVDKNIINNLYEKANLKEGFEHINDVWSYLEDSIDEEDLKRRIGDIPSKFGSFTYEIINDGDTARVTNDYEEYGDYQSDVVDIDFLGESTLYEKANPENEEKNKIIRQALKGPKNFEKNREALRAMGIKGSEREHEPGETIYIYGPNGKHVSVDPDGTNVWNTYGEPGPHYKKELSFKNRNSKNYNHVSRLDFNGNSGKDFDYYNYLTKPRNEYQDEVDQANKVKGYRDNQGKSGYNLPDEALTPEEKDLSKRTRKYVQLKKNREELEDKLAGYIDLKNDLDRTNSEIRRLHNKELEESTLRKDNYTATSIENVLEHENDDYAIKIENRTTGKETKWLNIEGAYLYGLYHDISDINSNNVDEYK